MTSPKGRSKPLNVTVVSGGFLPARGLGGWLEKHLPKKVRGTVTIKIVTDGEMAKLNGAFRGKPEPTDVLSFPSAHGAPPPFASAQRRSSVAGIAASPAAARTSHAEPRTSNAPRRTSNVAPRTLDAFRLNDLGDIAIAKGVARVQARGLGHPVSTELRVLALHGILHLLGYDHDRDRGEMRTVEERWRRRAGLPAGLVTRSERPPHTAKR